MPVDTDRRARPRGDAGTAGAGTVEPDRMAGPAHPAEPDRAAGPAHTVETDRAVEPDRTSRPLAALAEIAAELRSLGAQAEAQVCRARRQGASWKAIAAALGVSRQAAHKRFARRLGPKAVAGRDDPAGRNPSKERP